jgi:hypothetical protein
MQASALLKLTKRTWTQDPEDITVGGRTYHAGLPLLVWACPGMMIGQCDGYSTVSTPGGHVEVMEPVEEIVELVNRVLRQSPVNF